MLLLKLYSTIDRLIEGEGKRGETEGKSDMRRVRETGE